jgi:DegV family protein with EDD domain
MRIVTNPGSNLDEAQSLRLKVDMLPQKIVVDGISHDTRNTIDFGQVDGWLKRAHKHPQVQGTTEQEFIEYFSRLVQQDPEILCVMTSRKLIGSHDAAVAAVKHLKTSSDPKLRAARIEVVDSRLTDVGAGLCTLAAVSARDAGLTLEQTAAAVRAFTERGRNVTGVATLENLIKGGRASTLQGFVANFLNIRPILAMDDGAISSVARVSASADLGEKLDEWLSSRVDGGRAVWAAVAHGDVPARADALLARLQARYRCEVALARPLSPSIYLHCGRGALMVFLFPLDGLPFRPVAPLR